MRRGGSVAACLLVRPEKASRTLAQRYRRLLHVAQGSRRCTSNVPMATPVAPHAHSRPGAHGVVFAASPSPSPTPSPKARPTPSPTGEPRSAKHRSIDTRSCEYPQTLHEHDPRGARRVLLRLPRRCVGRYRAQLNLRSTRRASASSSSSSPAPARSSRRDRASHPRTLVHPLRAAQMDADARCRQCCLLAVWGLSRATRPGPCSGTCVRALGGHAVPCRLRSACCVGRRRAAAAAGR